MKLPSITYTQDALEHFDQVIDKEWLITNGLGGYSSSSVLSINTRKYHGLLVAALHPPGNRTICLTKLDEDVIVGNTIYRLGTNDFKDALYPQGYKYLKEFSISPNPTFNYVLGSVKIKKIIFMPKQKNVVCSIYHILNNSSSEVAVVIYPLLTCRYYHTVVDSQKLPLNFTQRSVVNGFQVTFERPQATIMSYITEGSYRESVNWIERLHYRNETERGEANLDDCFQPGYFMVKIQANTEKQFVVAVAADSEERIANEVLNSIGNSTERIQEALNQELTMHSNLLTGFYASHPEVPMSDWLNWVLLAADSFVVEDATARKSIIAGYFWFEPWGRDTFVSLPGIMLITKRFDQAKGILQNFSQYCKGGLIPNFIADRTGQPVYNTVDGTFWYINAVLQYLKYTGDWGFVKGELWQKLQEIINYHQKGTLYGIRLDDDGLIMHGPRLTWMDAVVEGDAITPRAGKAVEIQALYYNSLQIMSLLANKFGDLDLSQKYNGMAEKTRKSFNEKYWNPSFDCLYDVLGIEGVDKSLRPNQIFAVSLDFSMLDLEKSRKVVDIVNKELVTPFGLRTLSLNDPKFMGKCLGNRRSRDAAYHNGTIWPWLLGPYVTAYLRVNGYTKETRDFAFNTWILPFFKTGIHQGGLGTISEIFDCDPPNEPRGCISQAWSVGEPMRAYIEDIMMIKPKFSALHA